MNASGKLNTCKSNGNSWCLHQKTSGGRVRNVYAIYLLLGYSPEKFGLIPYNIMKSHGFMIKASVVEDEHASY